MRLSTYFSFALLSALAMIDFATSTQGRVVLEGPVFSRLLQTNRTIRIYLPDSYERDSKKRYPVLYVHDGQNAFTTVGPNVAFDWGNWELDKTAGQLAMAGKMREIIMVAIDCSPERYLEYRGPAASNAAAPTDTTKAIAAVGGDNRRFDQYARFLIEELKPKIDREYRTLPDARHTAAMGSSMGGICSLVLAWEHPKIFGGAASLSGAFQVERRHFLKNVLGVYRGRPKGFKIYLDSGVTDFSGGDDGKKDTEAVAQELRRIGWKDGKNLLYYVDATPLTEAELERVGLRRDKWKEAQTSQHNEFYWRLRVWRALTFLFPLANL